MKYQWEGMEGEDPNRNADWATSMWGNNFNNYGTGIDLSNPIKFKDTADGIYTAIRDWNSYRATNYQDPRAQPSRNTFGAAGGPGSGTGAVAGGGGGAGGAAPAAGAVAEPTAAGSAAEIVANAPSQATALASAKATAGGGIKSFLLKEGGKQALGKLTGGGGGGGGGGGFYPMEQYGFEKKDTYNKFGGSPLTTLYQKYGR